jgi:hypothetical protein
MNGRSSTVGADHRARPGGAWGLSIVETGAVAQALGMAEGMKSRRRQARP